MRNDILSFRTPSFLPEEQERQVLPSEPEKKKKSILGRFGDILTSPLSGPETEVPGSGIPQPDGSVVGARVTSEPTKKGKILRGARNVMEGVAAGMSQPSGANGAESFFRSLGAASRASDGRRQEEIGEQELNRKHDVEDYNLRRQIGNDKRADDRLEQQRIHQQAMDTAKGESNDLRGENDRMKAYQRAIETTHEAIDPTLNTYLTGQAAADYQAPEGFNRGEYEEVAKGKYAKRRGQTVREKTSEDRMKSQLAAQGFKLDGEGNVAKMTPEEISVVQGARAQKETAQAGQAEAVATNLNKKTSLLEKIHDLNVFKAQTGRMNASTAATNASKPKEENLSSVRMLAKDYRTADKDFLSVNKHLAAIESMATEAKRNPKAQTTLLNQFVKMNDDNAVKEGEVRFVQGSGSYLDQLNVLADKVKQGAIVSPKEIDDIVSASRAMKGAYQTHHDKVSGQFRSMAQRYNIPLAEIGIQEGAPLAPPSTGAPFTRPMGGGSPAAPPPPSGKIRVRSADGKTAFVNSDKLDAFLASAQGKGWSR